MVENNERRQYKRIKFARVGADYKLVDFNFWAEFRSRGTNSLKDISLGGISFSTNDAMPKDSLVSLNLKLGDVIKMDEVYGRVVRIRELKSDDYEIGINFSWWDKDEDRKKLARIIENNPFISKAG